MKRGTGFFQNSKFFLITFGKNKKKESETQCENKIG